MPGGLTVCPLAGQAEQRTLGLEAQGPLGELTPGGWRGGVTLKINLRV